MLCLGLKMSCRHQSTAQRTDALNWSMKTTRLFRRPIFRLDLSFNCFQINCYRGNILT